MKSYRLINAAEIQYWQEKSQDFLRILQGYGISCTGKIQMPQQKIFMKESIAFAVAEQIFLLGDAKSFSQWQEALLEESLPHPLYEHCTRKILQEACAAFAEQAQGQLRPLPFVAEDFCYPGSPCLELVLRFAKHRLSLYLHPQWVLQKIPPVQSRRSHFCAVEDCMGEEMLELTAVFPSFSLPIQSLRDLQVGDLLVLDQRFDKPLELHFAQQCLALAYLGQSEEKFALQLRGKS